jgi:(4-(4-[2-(gamma-L-glutamylamino)ethyl]phenoxymethyl)furan-2-yl)methanamine synthase
MAEPIIGWDVGGAHLKGARIGGDGKVLQVVQLPCPLWQGLSHLEQAIDRATTVLGTAPLHAVTMTGEMVDLFPDRSAGVRQLIETLRRRIPASRLAFYAGATGMLGEPETAGKEELLASANWRASAELVAMRLHAALLVDIGSTTTDLIPVAGGRVIARGVDDTSRMIAGELVYRGIVRTPLMALAHRAPYQGDWVPLMAEWFATTADVYRLTGELPDDADLHPAADGGEKSIAGSARRLARMIGRDSQQAPIDVWRELARWFARVQLAQIEEACDQVLGREGFPRDAPFVVAGAGRMIIEPVARRNGRRLIDFAELFECEESLRGRASDCAAAVAVALLARG